MTRLVGLLSLAGVLFGANFATVFDGNFPLAAGKEFTRNFTFYQGDTIEVKSQAVQGNDISELDLSDAGGNVLLSRYAYICGDEFMFIPTTGFYTVRAKNTATLKGKVYHVVVLRYNPNSIARSLSTAYVTKTVCDTTWLHFTRHDTLGLARVDTSDQSVFDEDVHLGCLLSSSQSTDVIGPIKIPAITYASGYEPTVVFYAANKESDRSLADALGNLGVGLALSGLGLGALGSAFDLSKVSKGEDFGWQLKQWALGGGQSAWVDYNVSNRIKISRVCIPYSVAVKFEWAAVLDNSSSVATNKDVTVRVYLVQCIPSYNVVSRPDSTVRVAARQIPVLPQGK